MKKRFNKLISDLKTAWLYIYGEKSHMNLAGKIIIGVPFFPFIFVFVFTFVALDFVFSKQNLEQS